MFLGLTGKVLQRMDLGGPDDEQAATGQEQIPRDDKKRATQQEIEANGDDNREQMQRDTATGRSVLYPVCSIGVGDCAKSISS